VAAGDFILAIAGVWQIDARGNWQAHAAGLLGVVMDRLRAGAPGRP
jgi:hypothetical protein